MSFPRFWLHNGIVENYDNAEKNEDNPELEDTSKNNSDHMYQDTIQKDDDNTTQQNTTEEDEEEPNVIVNPQITDDTKEDSKKDEKHADDAPNHNQLIIMSIIVGSLLFIMLCIVIFRKRGYILDQLDSSYETPGQRRAADIKVFQQTY